MSFDRRRWTVSRAAAWVADVPLRAAAPLVSRTLRTAVLPLALAALLTIAAVALAAPTALAAPATGGAALGSAPSTTAEDAASGGTAPSAATLGGAPASPVATVTASARGITLTARAGALLRRRATVTGVASPRLHAVRIEQRGATGSWSPVAVATVAADGTFAATWRPAAVGRLRLRARPATRAAQAGRPAPEVEVTVYRPGRATWYGPGFYGRLTACGIRLRRTTIGVAHRTLPCGTQVQLFYGGRTVVAPVIDRGPHARARSWDLTAATHAALTVRAGVFTVGALPLRDLARIATPRQAPPLRSAR